MALASLALAAIHCGSRSALVVSSADAPCPIYVLTTGKSTDTSDVLVRFDPPTNTFAPVVTVPCLETVPFVTTMAIDLAGYAFVVERTDIRRQLIRVSTSTGACEVTPFVPDLADVGMAFSQSGGGPVEALYLIDGSSLSSLDTSTFEAKPIGTDPSGTAWAFLTGTGAGDLFAESSASTPPPCPPDLPPDPDATPPTASQGGGRSGGKGTCSPAPPIRIGNVDKSSALVTTQWTPAVPPAFSGGLTQGFAFWGGDFYFFVGQGANEQAAPGCAVWRFRPADGSMVQVAQTGSTVLAVGVSTCAPTR